MNYLTNAIDNYINSPEPYALQIDGSWGIGKTYFITNYAREITEINNIYFSLYGYNDLETLKKELLLQIAIKLDKLSIIQKSNKLFSFIRRLDIKKSFTLSSISALSEVILEKYTNTKLQSNNKTIVVIMDDLERLGEKIDIQDFLGFIVNEIIEKLKFKIILISN